MKRLVVLAVIAFALPARADDPPWAVGVSEEHKTAAEKLLDAGNALFLDHKYADALEQYRQALAEWDHPAIRFNMVRCLIQIDRPVEASDELDQALRYGAAPLGDSLYAEALGYRKLLAGQIAELEVTCRQPGVELRLDGHPLGKCPTDEKRRVAPASHQVAGTLAGYMTKSIDIVTLGGRQSKVDIELVPIAQATTIVHRWKAWIPWTVFAVGFAIEGAGGLLELQASSNMNAYDRTVSRECTPTPCPPGQPDPKLLDSARLENRIAIGVMTAGAATIAAGAVMLYLNRGRTVVPDVEPRPAGATIGVAGRF